MADQLREVPTNSVRPNGKAALRSVDKSEAKWLEFVDSIKSKGILQSLLVRKAKDPETGSDYYSLIDGLHRWTAANDIGLETVPVKIITATDAEALESQMVTNLHQIATKAAKYADGLSRLLALNETLTIPELAEKLGKSLTWLTQMLKLTKLPESIKVLVDEGKINVTNAQELAQLPEAEINDFVDRAMTMSPQQFLPLVKQRRKLLKDAQSQGKEAPPKEFTPAPHLRGIADINKELESLSAGKSLINQFGGETPLDGWKLALDWVRHMDPASQEQQRAEDQARKDEKEKRRLELKAEKDRKKREEAAGAAVDLEEVEAVR